MNGKTATHEHVPDPLLYVTQIRILRAATKLAVASLPIGFWLSWSAFPWHLLNASDGSVIRRKTALAADLAGSGSWSTPGVAEARARLDQCARARILTP